MATTEDAVGGPRRSRRLLPHALHQVNSPMWVPMPTPSNVGLTPLSHEKENRIAVTPSTPSEVTGRMDNAAHIAKAAYQDENVSPNVHVNPTKVACASDSVSDYSPFSNPLAQRPATRTSAGFLALWTMNRNEKDNSTKLDLGTEAESPSAAEVSLAPAVEDCASSIKPSADSASSPMAEKAWGAMMESADDSWLTGSPNEDAKCPLEDSADSKSVASAAGSSLAFSFWPAASTTPTNYEKTGSDELFLQKTRPPILTPNAAREKLETKIPRKPMHPSRIPKPAREATSSSTMSQPPESHEGGGDSTADSHGEYMLHPEPQQPDVQATDEVKNEYRVKHAKEQSGNSGTAKSARAARDRDGKRASLGSSQEQDRVMQPHVRPARNTRRASSGSAGSSDLADELYAKANPGHNLLARAASKIYRRAAISGSSRVKGPSAAGAETGSTAPPCTPMDEAATPLVRSLRRCYGLFGGSSSPLPSRELAGDLAEADENPAQQQLEKKDPVGITAGRRTASWSSAARVACRALQTTSRLTLRVACLVLAVVVFGGVIPAAGPHGCFSYTPRATGRAAVPGLSYPSAAGDIAVFAAVHTLDAALRRNNPYACLYGSEGFHVPLKPTGEKMHAGMKLSFFGTTKGAARRKALVDGIMNILKFSGLMVKNDENWMPAEPALLPDQEMPSIPLSSGNDMVAEQFHGTGINDHDSSSTIDASGENLEPDSAPAINDGQRCNAELSNCEQGMHAEEEALPNTDTISYKSEETPGAQQTGMERASLNADTAWPESVFYDGMGVNFQEQNEQFHGLRAITDLSEKIDQMLEDALNGRFYPNVGVLAVAVAAISAMLSSAIIAFGSWFMRSIHGATQPAPADLQTSEMHEDNEDFTAAFGTAPIEASSHAALSPSQLMAQALATPLSVISNTVSEVAQAETFAANENRSIMRAKNSVIKRARVHFDIEPAANHRVPATETQPKQVPTQSSQIPTRSSARLAKKAGSTPAKA